MARKKTVITKPEDTDKMICTKCGFPKKMGDFYASNSIIYNHYGRISVCKDCIPDIYEVYYKKYLDKEKAIYLLCRRLDIPFSTGAFRGALEHAEKANWLIHQTYIKQINSFYSQNNYGTCFDESLDFLDIDLKSDDGEMQNLESDEELSFKISPDMKKKWNSNSVKEILFLENEYQDWCSRYDVSTKAMEVNIINICYQQLAISKKHATGLPVDLELKTLSNLMNDSALKPIQEAAAMSSEYNTLGTWIKRFENEEPCPQVDPELEDVDGFKKYIRIWFLGHLCKILGIENEYTKEYEEEMLKYTINFEEEINLPKEEEEEVEEIGLDE